MRRLIALSAALALSATLFTAPDVRAQKTKKADDKDGETKNTEKTVKAGVLIGRVMNVYEDKRRLRLSVSYPVTTLNPGAAGGIASAQQAMVQAQLAMRNARDVNGLTQAQQQMVQAQVQMAQAQAQMYQTKMMDKEIEVQATDDVAVRMAQPKQEFDDKGRIKKYTKAELKEMKGDSKQPGYKAEFTDVQNEQIVRVTMVRKKGETPAKVSPKKKGKDDETPADGLKDELPQVALIEILREAPTPK